VVSYLKPGDRRERGDHLGVIKFGSRVDLFVPEGYRVLVAVGDRVRNGETPMAEPGTAP
jgi:phosphatidylserine decarboxylase